MSTEAINPQTPYLLDPAFPNLEGNTRMERAKNIVESKLIKKINKSVFSVKSQSGFNVYTVTKIGEEYTCTCPDCIIHGKGWECKHIMAVKELLDSQDTKAKRVKKSDRNWEAYTLGQINEEELVRIFLRQLADTVETPVKKTGRPSIPYSDLLYCAVMKVYCGKSSRRAHTLLRDSAEKSLIEYVPNFNAVNKFLEKEDITPILHNLVRMSALPLAELETSFSIDSSGFRTNNFSEWCDEKHGKEYKAKNGDTLNHRREHQWVKCHISSGNLTNVIADVVITEHEGKNTADEKNFCNLLSGTTGFFNVEEICADKAYASRKNYAKADELNVIPYLLFKKNVSSHSKGCGLWSQMFLKFMTNHQEYMEHYNKRNNVESTFGALKAKLGDDLLSKNFVSQTNELLCKVLAYNLTVLASAFFVHSVDVEF